MQKPHGGVCLTEKRKEACVTRGCRGLGLERVSHAPGHTANQWQARDCNPDFRYVLLMGRWLNYGPWLTYRLLFVCFITKGLSRDSHPPYYGRIPNATHSPSAQDSLHGLTPQRASSVGSDLNVQSREAPFLNALSLHGTKFQLSVSLVFLRP